MDPVAAAPPRTSQPPPIQQMIEEAADLLSRQPIMGKFVRAPAAAAPRVGFCPAPSRQRSHRRRRMAASVDCTYRAAIFGEASRLTASR